MLLTQYKQALRDTNEPSAQAQLARWQAPSLISWHAEPATRMVAETLQQQAQRELQSRLCAGGDCFPLHVLQLISHFWMGVETREEAARLAMLARDQRESALLHLCYGQLLISRKLKPAKQHLARGFSLAVPYLESAEYFTLLRQHDLLSCLRLADRPSPPQSLSMLLAEAAVIRCLQQSGSFHKWNTHVDTIG